MHKTYDLYKLLYQYLETIPRKDRYVLGQKCENIVLNILELVIGTIQSPRNKKLELLNKTSIKLNILRIIIRLAKDVKAMDFKKYLTLQENINEIGKMLGGWIKSLK